jgi:ATP-binding cassette, subfamily F, member 3
MLILSDLSKNFHGRFVLKNINYNFPQTGLIALVGVNGAGKSTLLNILCNLDEPDNGVVSKPKSKLIGYLPQEPNHNPKDSILIECMSGASELFQTMLDMNKANEAMAEDFTNEKYEKFEYLENLFRSKDGYSFEHNASKILLGLGFREEDLQNHPKDLSGGWKMRLELAKILIKNPDFLILDEPTNHLDLPTIVWLEAYLKKFKGTVLFVSHDESLLNSLPNIILHLKDGDLTEYQGNYDDFLIQYELREANKIAALKNIEGKIETVSRFIERFGAKASKATQARSKMKMVARLERDASGITVNKDDAEINIRIPVTQKSGKEVITFNDCSIGYTKPLVKKIAFTAMRGQKIAIVGANGLGKSTLIKSLLNQVPFLAGDTKIGHNVKTAYYAQDQAEYLDMKKTVLENLKAANHELSEGHARGLLGSFLFRGNDVYKQVNILSGGEKSRLSLACLLVQNANFLLLDEPTNHLDILSTEILSEALATYEGTVMFVSHNRSFINAVATHTLAFSSKGTAYFSKGNIEELNLFTEEQALNL